MQRCGVVLRLLTHAHAQCMFVCQGASDKRSVVGLGATARGEHGTRNTEHGHCLSIVSRGVVRRGLVIGRRNGQRQPRFYAVTMWRCGDVVGCYS